MSFDFISHKELAGKHAELSPSKYHWLNYTDDKFDLYFQTKLMAARGTELHDYACKAIRLRLKQPDTGQTLNMYVNDAIGFRMTPEVHLAYSWNAFGQVDAIGFAEDPDGNWVLRIHDLKTGMTRVSFKQLVVYAALFCLEYDYKPGDLIIELRIYQNDDFEYRNSVSDHDLISEIVHAMDKIVHLDRRINEMTRENWR